MPFSIHTLYAHISPLFRKRRMRLFVETFRPGSSISILDVGGYPETWTVTSVRSSITVLNVHEIDYAPNPGDPPIRTIVGNGCHLDFDAKSFDIVFSNSVIEHLGTLENQEKFARECRRVGRRLWVQTPARSFFIEPHLLTPFIHFLPARAQRALIPNFTVWGLLTRPTSQQVRAFMAEVRLLNRAEMQALFPDCTIVSEKVLGLTKSYVAMR
jgi:Methyltransferase domain